MFWVEEYIILLKRLLTEFIKFGKETCQIKCKIDMQEFYVKNVSVSLKRILTASRHAALTY